MEADHELDLHWKKMAEAIQWIQFPKHIKTVSFQKPVVIEWFKDGILNASMNCLDRHLKDSANRVAYIFEPDEPGEVPQKITYQELHRRVNVCSNVLKDLDVKKGDRVTIYMPMTVDAVVAMLACSRIGAIHSVIFGGFAPDSLVSRIEDCESDFVITSDETRRGGRKHPLKANVDLALLKTSRVRAVLVFTNTGTPVPMKKGRDYKFEDLAVGASDWCDPEPMGAEDPLFLLYTSGSTGKPKGVVHTTGGYLTWVHETFQKVFQYKQNQIYWCTADVGWITGHSYIAYGPLSCGATSVLFEGVPNYPMPSRFWQVIDRHQVNIFYTAPTALRALMREGDSWVKECERKSLQLLGSVGEPINPEAWRWYFEVVGDSRCNIVDTWWQTETGGILISPVPGETNLKPGSATKPLPGIRAEILSSQGEKLTGPGEGLLVLSGSWPGQMRTVFKDHARFEQTYFSQFPGYYFTGDGAKRDIDGDFWITGRVDDVLNVSGHRLGTAEIESVFVAHPDVAEAAVVGYPHDIKGQGIYCYITLNKSVSGSEELRKELVLWVRGKLGSLATPDLIQWAPGLPKTRSGKIMRRILRKIAENETSSLGDTSTLADPTVVQDLVDHRLNRG